eukprot:SAG31_NODE_125_length_23649_cov_7.156202_8_plen_102_part_00
MVHARDIQFTWRANRVAVFAAADSTGAIVLAIYSHGDRHRTAGAGEMSHEWYTHLPYETDRHELYEMVATDGAPSGRPHRCLYATQLRQVFCTSMKSVLKA